MKRLGVLALPLGLESLDRMSVDVLVLSHFEDERPLRGATGYCDWRLNGRLSRMLQKESFLGKPRDVVLTDTGGRIGSPRVLLFGQGKRYSLDLAIYKRRVRKMIVDVKKACFKSYAIELPGVDPGPLHPEQAIYEFLDAAATIFREGPVTLLSHSNRFTEQITEAVGNDDRISLISSWAPRDNTQEIG
jgi:hypothetical protein